MPAIGVGIGALFAGGATAAAIGGAVLKLALSVALSKLQQAAMKKKLARNGGIATEQTVSGESHPEAFILGTTATGGHMVCPPMSHGSKNKFLTYVIELASHPGVEVTRLIIDNNYVTLAGTTHPTYGRNVLGPYANNVFLKVYDGTQTSVDPMLSATYNAYSGRPWGIDMIGNGISYAILTFVYNANLFRALPQVKFEVNGMKLYDPRKDSTNGGSGSHRWSNPATWEFTLNPMVMAYNVMRGIQLPGGRVWSDLKLAAADLPVAYWFPAMNVCDATVVTTSGSELAYRAGGEFFVSEEPADVLDQLLNGCSGDLVDVGGIWKAQAGAPALPVFSFTDADTLITEAGSFDPFPGLEETYNGVQARYPDPDALWEVKDAPPRFNATYETADLGRQLIADLEFPAVPFKRQVQRLMKAYIEDERRFRRHEIPLGPEVAALEPLVDTISWTSAANGYSSKLFEISELHINTRTLQVTMSVRERDPADYSWSTGDEVAVPNPTPAYVGPDPLTVSGFAAAGAVIADASNTSRRPAVRLFWTAADEAGNDALDFQIRVAATGLVVSSGTTAATDTGEIRISAGLIPGTNYEARMRPVIAGLTTVWTAWTPFTTPNTLLDTVDLNDNSVTRPKIINYAVTDLWQQIIPGPLTGSAPSSPSFAVLATLGGLGVLPKEEIRLQAAVFTARKTGGASGSYLRFELQQTHKEFGGTFGAWFTVWTWNTEVSPSAGLSDWVWWQTDVLAGNYDDIIWRLIVYASGSPVSYSVEDICLTVTNVVR